jgi:(4-O-methyl)-D-glucuronate---lignin esterase
VSEIAEVELNGQNLGILWKPPTRLDITAVAKPGKNQLTVRVTNFWPNRIIGDQVVRDSERVTQTNIRKLTASTPLMSSGLLGPVRLLTVIEQPLQFQTSDRQVSQRSNNSATQ